MVKITKEIGAVAFILIMLGAALSLSSVPYPGGGEIVSGVVLLDANDKLRTPMGQHSIADWDIDGDFEDYNWTPYDVNGIILALETEDGLRTDDISMPGLSVETSNPYNLQKIGDTYVKLGDEDDPVIAKMVEKSYTVGGETTVYQYNLMYYGLDITYKTSADVYYKDPAISIPFGLWGDWGYYFEDGVLDIAGRQSFVIAPWSPVGVYNSTTDANNVTTTYTITEGWAGVLDAIVYDRSFGLVDESATENYNHVLQNVITPGTTLNMYYHDTSNDAYSVEFTADSALLNVPSSVDIETSCTLGAGAQYHVTGFGNHWDSCAVRNVKVQYKILIKVAATIEMTKLVVTGEQQGETSEDNTFYKPQVTFWSDVDEWWAGVSEYWSDIMNDPGFVLMLIGGILVVMLILYFVLKFMR